jgi:hypothetical protein
MKLSKAAMSKRCDRWPDCICARDLVHWQRVLEKDDHLTLVELEDAQCNIFFSLCCVAYRCPDRKVRSYATVQLLNPFWNRERNKIPPHLR